MTKKELKGKLLESLSGKRAIELAKSNKRHWKLIVGHAEKNMCADSIDVDAHYLQTSGTWLEFIAYTGEIEERDDQSYIGMTLLGFVYVDHKSYKAKRKVVRRINQVFVREIIEDFQDLSKGFNQ